MSMLFQTSKNILFKLGATKQLGEIMVKERCKHVCIVTDKGIRNAGLLDDGVASLKAAGVEVTIFDEVVPDPLESNIYDGTKLCIDNGVDGIIGFGGGSSMDVLKLLLTSPKKKTTELNSMIFMELESPLEVESLSFKFPLLLELDLKLPKSLLSREVRPSKLVSSLLLFSPTGPYLMVL